MGKKNSQGLGKSIIKQRTKSGGNIKHANNWLHCSELDSGPGPSVQSITEQTDLDDFLATAELAGTEFAAEKLNTTIITERHNDGLVSRETAAAIKQAQQENQHFLRIPRRPEWDKNMTAEELDQQERESFLDWRRQLAELQEKEHIILTPFERNLDFWRQLWRVIERSDVIVQIVDARNPLLFRCEDLENYVIEVDPNKCNLLLINKADFLSPEQRCSWARYFKSIGLPVAFWSAQQENDRLMKLRAADGDKILEEKEKEEEEREEEAESDIQKTTLWSRLSEMSVENEEKLLHLHEEEQGSLEDHNIHDETTKSSVDLQSKCTENLSTGYSDGAQGSDSCEQDTGSDTCIKENEQSKDTRTKCDILSSTVKEVSPPSENICIEAVGNEEKSQVSDSEDESQDSGPGNSDNIDEKNATGQLLTRDELLALFKMLHMSKLEESGQHTQTTVLTTVGLVGYPNVGKSSTINTLLNDKKVPVSATPGRTKHFQTLYVNDEVLLCDCPGLVFPSFVSTKADMILNGILPIDQMRDHIPPVSLLCQRIPRAVLEVVYGITIPPPQEEDDSNRAPFADELLSAYGHVRGFMTSHGIPDGSRSARYILKDYVKGKLLYCIAPPGEDEKQFEQMGYKVQKLIDAEGKETNKKDKVHRQMNDVDKDFFKQEHVRCFSRGVTLGPRPLGGAISGQDGAMPYKPWKKHCNKNKREKLRRLAKK